ncbi:MAG TPA: rod shape-determining protein MreD [Candidatus Binataceae bacterium]|nr:rod shape-determining protein MreD [Candidatus Binataceae bacterium]
MRLAALFIIAAVVALTLQSGALHWLTFGALVPDLILILAVDLGLKHPSAGAAILAFAMGLATDALSGSRVGLNAFMITLVFLLCYELSRHLWVSGYSVASLAVFFGVVIKDVGILAVTGSFDRLEGADPELIRIILTHAVLTALLALLIFPVLDSGKRMLRLPRRAERE